MGKVFLAEDIKLGRRVAIKFLLEKGGEDDLARKRLIREAQAAAALDHPNICAIHEINDEGPRPFIVMQYIEGDNLAKKIKDHPLELAEIIEIAEQLIGALIEAHSRGIIHRDIKPQNIIVTARGQIKILDFGLAKILPESKTVQTESDTLSQLTEAGQVVGTAGYMSPELLKGEPVDSRTDIFSLGVVLYNCATGKATFTGSSTLEICLKVIQFEPPKPSDINPEVPKEMERIILKAMARDVDARYQTASDLLSDLLELKATLREESQIRTSIMAHAQAPLHFRVPAQLSGLLRGKPLKFAFLIAPVFLILVVWLALPLLRGAHHIPPPEARLWFDRGTNAIREGSYYQATKALNHALELDNNFALAHARLAEAYMEVDSSDRAKEEILTAISLVSDRTALPKLDAIYLDAIVATVRRELTGAIAYYQEIVRQAPESEKSSAYMDLGRAYEKNEDIDKAIELYQKAAHLAPESPGAFLRLAILYGRKQDIKSASDAFDKAEKIYSDLSNQEGTAEVFFQRGVMLNKINKIEDARVQLEKALSIARQIDNKYQQIRAQLQLSTVYIEDNAEVARSTATEAINLAQANNLRNLAVNGLIDLGYTFLRRGEYDEADRYFKQALDFARVDNAPRNEARALLALGMLNVTQGNDDEGIHLLEQALAFYKPAGYRKETSLALTMMGRAQRSKGNYEEAIKIFEEQLHLSEELGDSAMVADSHLSLALTCADQERYPEALPHIEESYKIDKSSGFLMNTGYDEMNRAESLGQLGRYDEARSSLSKALSIASRPEAEFKTLQAWVHMIYAQIALSERNLAEAIKEGRQVLELAGKDRDLTTQAKCSIGLAQALSGESKTAITDCEEAVAVARETKSPSLVSSALLSLAEVMLQAKDAKGAIATALQAQEMFARAGQRESEWRSLLVAATASQIAGNMAQAADYAARSDSLLSALQQDWGAQVFEGYTRRPDIRSYRNQLAQLLRIKN